MKRKLFKKKPGRLAASKIDSATRAARRIPVLNILLASLLWISMIVFFYSGRLMKPHQLTAGQQAPETIVASVDFEAENIAATQEKQRAAADRVLPVFSIDLTATENLRRVLTTDQLSRLLPSDGQSQTHEVIFSTLSNTVAQGIISAADAQTRFNGAVPYGKLTVRGGTTDTIRTLDSFAGPAAALKQAVAEILKQLPRESRDEETLRALIAPWLWPNLVYDAAETAARRTLAAAAVEPVIEPVSAGTILIRNGDTVRAQTIKWLAAHEQRRSELETPAERIRRVAGSGLLLLMGLILTAAVAAIVQPGLLRDSRKILLLITLSILPLAAAKGLLVATAGLRLLPPGILVFALPLSFAPLMASILLGGVPALIAGLWTSFAMASLPGGSFAVFFLGLLVSAVSVFITRDVKRRAALFRAGFWTGATGALFAMVLAVQDGPALPMLLLQIAAALLNGLLCALLAMLLIPLFEHVFKITTDISLLELSDLSHPLLQSLAINAPGTYHHSLMMASLAQNAAEAIGANGLSLRVCAYFHDIGKLVKPGFFSENIQFTENPHDELTPSMSTLVIISHIKEGVMLARKYKLPQVIIDGIEQHQGTSLVTVFYHRAKTLQKEAGTSPSSVNTEDFRYEGPRPQNREMAILMLADGCEAASRSLEKPTPVRIANLISDIFDSRLRDGQLDECNLTLAELNTVKHSFIFSLTSMLHGRVAYPKEESAKSETPDQNES